MTTQLPTELSTALSDRKIDFAVWNTLKNSVFPGAKDDSILLAIDYCKARKMDILKKPCHIVPMQVTLSGEKVQGQDGKVYDKKIWRDVIMPGIYEQRITAFRTGQMAGQDEPVFGETIEYLSVQAPQWCKVTVYRFINGERCAFSHTEYFEEACSTTKDGKINSMWTKRPRGQLAKCAEAGALRKAFPDELGGVITVDEVLINEDTSESIEQPKTTVIEGKAIELITPEQRTQLEQLIEIDATNVSKALAYYGADSIDQLTKINADHFIKTLNTRIDKNNAKVDQVETGEEIPL